MAAPTTTGKPYLVMIQTQAGAQPQIWYEDGGRFVGCSHLKPMEKYELPGSSWDAPWPIAAAVEYVASTK